MNNNWIYHAATPHNSLTRVTTVKEDTHPLSECRSLNDKNDSELRKLGSVKKKISSNKFGCKSHSQTDKPGKLNIHGTPLGRYSKLNSNVNSSETVLSISAKNKEYTIENQN